MLAPWPPYWTRFDAIANVIAYVPFGFFVALCSAAAPPLARMAVAIGIGAGLSFALETAQMYLPSRDASTLDLLANVGGTALGALGGVAVARSARAAQAIARFRDHWFLPGKFGDLGIALLVIWLAAQVNPGIPLFATTFDPDIQLDPALATVPRCRPTSRRSSSSAPPARSTCLASACSWRCCCDSGATSAARCWRW